jgi:hypothetical protein
MSPSPEVNNLEARRQARPVRRNRTRHAQPPLLLLQGLAEVEGMQARQACQELSAGEAAGEALSVEADADDAAVLVTGDALEAAVVGAGGGNPARRRLRGGGGGGGALVDGRGERQQRVQLARPAGGEGVWGRLGGRAVEGRDGSGVGGGGALAGAEGRAQDGGEEQEGGGGGACDEPAAALLRSGAVAEGRGGEGSARRRRRRKCRSSPGGAVLGDAGLGRPIFPLRTLGRGIASAVMTNWGAFASAPGVLMGSAGAPPPPAGALGAHGSLIVGRLGSLGPGIGGKAAPCGDRRMPAGAAPSGNGATRCRSVA